MLLNPSALLLDCDDLEGVREALCDLGVEVEPRGRRSLEPAGARGRDLLVTDARAALTAAEPFVHPAGEPCWVVFHHQDFLPLRARLRRQGVDYLVHASLEPDMVRLVLAGAVDLGLGPERRRHPRLPVGGAVRVHAEDGVGSATLAEIGEHGCRLLSAQRTVPGERLTVEIPTALTGARALRAEGRVRWAARGRGPGVKVAGLELEGGLLEAAIAHLRTGRAIGARVTCLRQPDAPVAGPAVHRAAEPCDLPKERRLLPRARFDEPLLAVLGSGRRLRLMPRDISAQGLRVERYGALDPGLHLDLAIPGVLRQDLLQVRAAVARDDDVQGLALCFRDLDPAQRRHIERLMLSLSLLEGRRGS